MNINKIIQFNIGKIFTYDCRYYIKEKEILDYVKFYNSFILKIKDIGNVTFKTDSCVSNCGNFFTDLRNSPIPKEIIQARNLLKYHQEQVENQRRTIKLYLDNIVNEEKIQSYIDEFELVEKEYIKNKILEEKSKAKKHSINDLVSFYIDIDSYEGIITEINTEEHTASVKVKNDVKRSQFSGLFTHIPLSELTIIKI